MVSGSPRRRSTQGLRATGCCKWSNSPQESALNGTVRDRTAAPWSAGDRRDQAPLAVRRLAAGPVPTLLRSHPPTRRRALPRSPCSSTRASTAPGPTSPPRARRPTSRSWRRASSPRSSDLRVAKQHGADAALLILRDLDDAQVADLLAAAAGIGLDTLVEAHDAGELDRAVRLDAPVIGINARDLATFRIDRGAQLELVARAPRDRIVVAESGIHTRAQGAAAELAGADAILVGSALMQAPDPAAAARGARLATAGQGLRADPRGGRPGGRGSGRRPARLRARARQPTRRGAGVLHAPETVLTVAVWVGEAGDSAADLDQVHERAEGKVRGRDATSSYARGEPSAGCSTCPGTRRTPPTGSAPRPQRAPERFVLAGGLGAGERRRGDRRPCGPGRSTPARRSRPRPAIKDHDRISSYVEAARA